MENISLLELQSLIKQRIEGEFALPYWITAEINEIKVNSSGHCYLELVQKGETSDFMEARMSAVIWANMFRLLRSYFETSAGRSLEAGIKVLVKGHVQYHELYGLSLNITDIDPSYTIGSIELQRQKTIRQLQDDGVFDMNKEFDIPLLPQHIAIISSKQAAGYQDFMQHLSQNEYGFKFYTQLFNATMQGKDAEQSIINALDSINSQIDRFNTVVIIRGGGSQADLACFDSYQIAYNVAQFPLPVLTGIGHDKDISVTDMVACQMLKTPTAVAAFLVDCLLEQDTLLQEQAERLRNVVNESGNQQVNYLQTCCMRLKAASQHIIAKEKQKVENWYPKQLEQVSQYYIREQLQVLKQLETEVVSRDPLNILKRGYSLTYANNKVITDSSTLKKGDIVKTVLMQGKFTSQITKID